MEGNSYIVHNRRDKFIVYALSVIFIIIAYDIFFGLGTLDPTNISWLLSARHDWGQHYLGWAFYRNEPWGFPLGQIDSLCYPVGTNVGYWDSIPLVAIILKIFSPLLPDDFQYLGLWLLSCYFMAAYYTIKIFRLYTSNILYILIGVLFVACNPVLVYRGLHPALCAHGFIIAAIYYYLVPATPVNTNQLNRKQARLAIISSLVNPYICAMVLGFSLILPLKHYWFDKLLSFKKALWYIVSTLIIILLLWLLIGMVSFGGNSFEGGSYGILSFNLNSLFNGGGFAVFLPEMPWHDPGQYEGYMYLGAGMMAAIVLAILYFVFAPTGIRAIKTKKYWLPLFILALVFTLFAISNRVTYNQAILFEISIPEIINRLGSIFRACGRFLWPVYYLAYFFALLTLVTSRFPNWTKGTVLAALLALQLYDSKPLYTFRHLAEGAYDTPLDEAKWNAVIPAFDRMITWPPFEAHLLNGMDYQDLCFLALKNGKAITTGYSARPDLIRQAAYTDSLAVAMDTNELLSNELYITTPKYLDGLSAIIHKGKYTVQYLDGYYLLYDKKKGINDKLLQTPEAIRKTDSVKAVYSQTKFLKVIDRAAFTQDKIKYNIEELAVNDDNIRVKGWAFLEGRDNNKGDSVFVTVTAGDKTYIAQTGQFARPDLTTAYKKQNLESSGFSAAMFTDGLGLKDYSVGIAVKSGNAWTFASLGSVGEIQSREKPFKLDRLPAKAQQEGNIDVCDVSGKTITVSGWSVFTGEDAADNEICVVFMAKGKNYAVATKKVMRPDVTESYKNRFSYDACGFTVRADRKNLPKGTYTTGILIRNKKTGKESLMKIDKTVIIK